MAWKGMNVKFTVGTGKGSVVEWSKALVYGTTVVVP